MKKLFVYTNFRWLVIFGIFALPFYASAAVVINEIAWMGTSNSTADEWIELANTDVAAVDLTGWTLEASDGTPKIALSGSIAAGGFFLLERTGDDTVPDITADQIYTGALGNSGEVLALKDSGGSVIDTVDASGGWPAGDNATKQTMQRDGSNWVTANATPRQANASQPAPTPPPARLPDEQAGVPTPTPTPESTPTPPPAGGSTPTPQPTFTPTPTPTPQPSITPSPLTSTPTPEPSKSANPTIVAVAPNNLINVPPPKPSASPKPTQAKPTAVPAQKNLASVSESISVPSVTQNDEKENGLANVSTNQNPYLWLTGSILAGLAFGAFVIFMTKRGQTDL